ncbi:hypothetical protein NHX12_000956 [Muraenolepis orangiensis]|uniref:non-specific serine/threonine protein kinase n=1 Tax=Muraenolepis orangiensis TaxID=630683 RepID=A0A9Q0IGP5_9TELE|nr:hypothetical protein NHX12_000956 [Muraenolepis orangiensis]
MCCLSHAFEAPSFLSVVVKIMEGPTPKLPPTYSPDLSSVMQRMLDKQSSSRPGAADVLRSSFIQKNMQSSLAEKHAAQIAQAMQGKVHLRTLRERCLAEEKYREVSARRQELRTRHFETLSLDVFTESPGGTLRPSQPITAEDRPLPGGSEPMRGQPAEDTCPPEQGAHAHTSPHSSHLPSQLTPPLTAHTSPHSSHLPSQLTPPLTAHTSPHSSHLPSQLTPPLTAHTSPHSSHLPSQLTPPLTAHTSGICDSGSDLGAPSVSSEGTDVLDPPGPPHCLDPPGSQDLARVHSSLVETCIQRMRELLCRRLGEEVSQKLYEDLKEARQRGEGDSRVLDTLVPRDGFLLDQILYHEDQQDQIQQNSQQEEG